MAERGPQHLQRLAVRDEHQRLLPGVAPARRLRRQPLDARVRGVHRLRAASRSSRSAGPSTAASAAPDASARRMRSTFWRRATSLAAGAARSRGFDRFARLPARGALDRRSGCRPAAAARRCPRGASSWCMAAAGVPRCEPGLETSLFGKLLGPQELEQPEEAVRVVLERRRAQEQHVPAEAPRSAPPRATAARRDVPAAAAAAAPRPRRADRCPPPPPARSAPAGRSASRARSPRAGAARRG